jgi:hypothetical protein
LISPGASEFVKWLTNTGTTGGNRFVLALVAILGAISFSALTGTPLNVDSVNSLVQVAFEALAAFLAARILQPDHRQPFPTIADRTHDACRFPLVARENFVKHQRQ